MNTAAPTDTHTALQGEATRLADPQQVLDSETAHLEQIGQAVDTERWHASEMRTRLTETRALFETAYRQLGETQAALAAEAERLVDAQARLVTAEAVLGHDRQRLEAEEVRLADAQRDQVAERDRLADAQRDAEAERARLAAERAQLAASRAELAGEQTRLSESWGQLREENDRVAGLQHDLEAEQVRLAADRASLEAERQRLADAEAALAVESDRLAELQRRLNAERARLTGERWQPEAERTPLADAPATTDAAENASADDQSRPEVTDAQGAGAGRELNTKRAFRADTAGVAQGQSARTGGGMDTDEARAVDMQPERDVDHGCLLDGSRGVNPLDVPAPETSGTSYKMLVERTGATDVLDDDRQIAAVARLLDVHDHHVPGYSKRLAEWAEALARALSCSAKELEAICRAALLHGIGKIDVPETTLKKSARLNDREHTMLRNQPVVAYRMLHDIAGLGAVATLLRHRFEHWDGTGYPDGLKGDAIPVGARILAVVEAYGEMVIGRPGAPKLYFRDAIAALRGEAGTQFDPEVAEAFCAIALESGRDAIKQG